MAIAQPDSADRFRPVTVPSQMRTTASRGVASAKALKDKKFVAAARSRPINCRSESKSGALILNRLMESARQEIAAAPVRGKKPPQARCAALPPYRPASHVLRYLYP